MSALGFQEQDVLYSSQCDDLQESTPFGAEILMLFLICLLLFPAGICVGYWLATKDFRPLVAEPVTIVVEEKARTIPPEWKNETTATKFFWDKDRAGYKMFRVEAIGRRDPITAPDLTLWTFMHPTEKESTSYWSWGMFDSEEECRQNWELMIRKSPKLSEEEIQAELNKGLNFVS